MEYLSELKTNKEIFINFMKEKYPVFNNSNIFLRDILYAVKSYFERKEKFLRYSECEKIALEFTNYLEQTNEIKKVGNNAWKVNFLVNKVVNNSEAAIN